MNFPVTSKLAQEIECITPDFNERPHIAKGPRFVGEFDPPTPSFAFEFERQCFEIIASVDEISAGALRAKLQNCDIAGLQNWLLEKQRAGVLRARSCNNKGGIQMFSLRRRRAND